MKIKNAFSNMYAKSGVMLTLAMSSSAFADTQSTNYLDTLVSKVDVASAISGVVAVAAVIMGFRLAVFGIRWAMRALNW